MFQSNTALVGFPLGPPTLYIDTLSPVWGPIGRNPQSRCCVCLRPIYESARRCCPLVANPCAHTLGTSIDEFWLTRYILSLQFSKHETNNETLINKQIGGFIVFSIEMCNNVITVFSLMTTLSPVVWWLWKTKRLLCVVSLTTDAWIHIHDVLLPKYSQLLNGVNIMSGPIFDDDYDGNVDALRAISG